MDQHRWVLDLGGAPVSASLQVLVHQHPAAPQIWCLTAPQAGLDLHELAATDAAAARTEALELLDRVLSRRLQLVRRAKGARTGAPRPPVEIKPAAARRIGRQQFNPEARKDA